MARSTQWVIACGFLIAGIGAGSFMTGQFLHGQPEKKPSLVAHDVKTFRHVVKEVLPAVVSIEARTKPVNTKRPQVPRRPQFDGLPIPEEFRKFMEEQQVPSPPARGFGSGVIVDPTGVILTNHHVVSNSDQVVVKLSDGRKFNSKDIHSDPKTDLAIVRIDADKPLPHLEMGDSDTMHIGDRVLAVGAPFGLTGSVTHGIISAKGRTGLSMNMYEDFIQTDAAINPGNSGGPLVNLEGKVIGINSAIRTRSGGFQGVGLAISSNLARTVKEKLLKDGVVKRGYLGVQIKDISDAGVAKRLGLEDGKKGILVSLVYDRSPAAKAGLKPGDVVTSIGGKAVTSSMDLQRLVAGLPLDKPVELLILRDGEAKTLSVTIEEQPQDFGTARVPLRPAPSQEKETVNLDKIGLEVGELTPQLAKQMGYDDATKGVVIVDVERGSMADVAGLARGTLVLKVDKQKVESPEQFRDMVDNGSLAKGVLLQVQSARGGIGYLLLKDG